MSFYRYTNGSFTVNYKISNSSRWGALRENAARASANQGSSYSRPVKSNVCDVRWALRVLGLTVDQIKDVRLVNRRWKKMLMLNHPDKNGQSRKSTEMTQSLNTAKKIIDDAAALIAETS